MNKLWTIVAGIAGVAGLMWLWVSLLWWNTFNFDSNVAFVTQSNDCQISDFGVSSNWKWEAYDKNVKFSSVGNNYDLDLSKYSNKSTRIKVFFDESHSSSRLPFALWHQWVWPITFRKEKKGEKVYIGFAIGEFDSPYSSVTLKVYKEDKECIYKINANYKSKTKISNPKWWTRGEKIIIKGE